MIDYFFAHQKQVIVGFTLLGFLLIWLRKHILKKQYALESLLASGISLTLLPISFLLFIGAFDETRIGQIDGLSMYLAIAGLACFFMAAKYLESDWKK